MIKLNYIKREGTAFASYIKVNWRNLVSSVILGIFLFWILLAIQMIDKNMMDRVTKLEVFLPDIKFLITFEVLIFAVFFQKCVSFWLRYRNSYFLAQPPFLLVDGFLITVLPVIYFLVDKLKVWEVYHIKYSAICFGLFVTLTYIFALLEFIKKQTQCDKSLPSAGEYTTISDEPIEEDTDDLIGRKRFANTLKDNIYKLSFKKSFVISLCGRWGEGKTSILNLLKNQIIKDDNLIVYDFDPWFFGGEEALTKNFYLGLEDTLKEKYYIPKEIKKSFKFYPEILIKGFAGISLQMHDDNEDRPLELKKRIEKFISSLDKRILVIIDDLDRLQAKEILSIFRLVKLTSRMKNMVFLISFDQARVVSTLQSEISMKDAQDYIGKIVQLPIEIPLTDQKKIDQFLLFSYPNVGYVSEIDKLFNRLGINGKPREEFDKEFTHIYQSELRQVFSTYRNVKRYLNSIFFRLPLIEKEINLCDFFLLEILQTFFPCIYSDIKQFPGYYVSRWSLEMHAYSPLSINEKEGYEQIKKHIEQILPQNDNDKKLVVSILKKLFPEANNAFANNVSRQNDEEYRRNKRIAHPDCFDKYFMLGVREGVIPDGEYESLISEWMNSSNIEDNIKNSFFEKYQKEFKLLDLIQRLKLNAGQLDIKLLTPLINVIYKNCTSFLKGGDLWMTEFDQAEGLIFRIFEDNQNIQNNQIHGMLKEIVEKTENYYFASLVVLTCNESRGSSLFRVHQNINAEELRGVLKGRLESHFIKSKRDVFEEYREEREFGFILYQWATNWSDQNKPRNDEVSGYLLSLFDKNPKRAGFFMLHFTRKGLGWKEQTKYFEYNEFILAYDPKKFYVFFERAGEVAYSTESEKEAVSLFLNKYREENSVKTIEDIKMLAQPIQENLESQSE